MCIICRRRCSYLFQLWRVIREVYQKKRANNSVKKSFSMTTTVRKEYIILSLHRRRQKNNSGLRLHIVNMS